MFLGYSRLQCQYISHFLIIYDQTRRYVVIIITFSNIVTFIICIDVLVVNPSYLLINLKTYLEFEFKFPAFSNLKRG